MLLKFVYFSNLNWVSTAVEDRKLIQTKSEVVNIVDDAVSEKCLWTIVFIYQCYDLF